MSKTKKEILDDLKEISDEKYKEFDSKLSPEEDNILGIRIPKLREYAKSILSQKDWKTTFNNIESNYKEEKMLKGIIIGQAKIDNVERFNYLKKFIPEISGWAICDITCCSLKFTKKNLKEVWNFLIPYSKSKKEFDIRFVLVMYLDYFVNDEYIDKIISNIKKININIKEDMYYAQMGMAWLISEMYIKLPKETKVFLLSKDNNLDKFTYNKSIQKIIESYRVSEDDKNMLRKIKK